MDCLSGPASVMAAVSLTIQLVDTVNTVREFWMKMKNAQAEVGEIIDDLALLNSILDGVLRAYNLHEDPNDADPVHAKSVYLALLRCRRHVDNMAAFVDGLQIGFVGKPYRTAFKAALRKHRIAEFAGHLEQAKLTLLMAINVTTLLLQNECGKRVQEQFSSLRSDMMGFAIANTWAEPSLFTLDSKSYLSKRKVQEKHSKIVYSKSRRIAGSDILLWLLKLPSDSPCRKVLAQYGRLIGSITWQSSTKVLDDHHDHRYLSGCGSLENSVMISIEIPIVRRAFKMRSQKYLGQWTHSFRVSRIVPDDAPIFKVCATKDEATVRKLFDSGLASPFDQTASGVTLLHVAAAGFQYRTYKLLCDARVEYGLCEDTLYGRSTPIELTQHSTLFVEGKQQTVQEWLGIVEDQASVFHPENHYQSVCQIWNHSIESQEEISDRAIITLLQGPLLLPREPVPLLHFTARKHDPGPNDAPLRYSPSLHLLCYYFMFRHDPHGRRITNATISSPDLKNQNMSFYEYVGQYWDSKEWRRLAALMVDLDFHNLHRRQQDKNLVPSSYRKIWDTDQNKWSKRRITRLSSLDDRYVSVWIGPLKDWIATFEFEEDMNEDGEDIEGCLSVESALQRKNMHLSWELGWISPTKGGIVLQLIKSIRQTSWLYWLLLPIALHYLLGRLHV